MGHAASYRDFDFVPVAGPVIPQTFVGTGQGVVAALKLSAAQEDAAVRVRRGAEFQTQDEVLREVLRGGKLLNSASLGRSGDDQPAIFGDKSPVGAARLAVEADGGCDNGPRRGVGIAGLPFSAASPWLSDSFRQES